MDPRLSDITYSSTLCYLPCLNIDVTVEAICAAKPSLSLGNDLVDPAASALPVSSTLNPLQDPALLANVSSISMKEPDISWMIMRSLFCLVTLHVPAFGRYGRDAFSFMWPADMTDKTISDQILGRNTRIIDAELNRWPKMDDWLTKKSEAKDEATLTSRYLHFIVYTKLSLW
jgi:hypothetical protein